MSSDPVDGSFVEEYKAARVDFRVTESGFEKWAITVLPDSFSYFTLALAVLWSLAAIGFAMFQGLREFGASSYLIFPGVALAFVAVHHFARGHGGERRLLDHDAVRRGVRRNRLACQAD